MLLCNIAGAADVNKNFVLLLYKKELGILKNEIKAYLLQRIHAIMICILIENSAVVILNDCKLICSLIDSVRPAQPEIASHIKWI